MPAPIFSQSIDELLQTLEATRAIANAVSSAETTILQSLRRGGKLLTCGNGGSAADALHLAEELVGRFKNDRRALPAICLNADVTALTCIGNDYGFDAIFSRQAEALGKPGDVLVGFSTSGNSRNVNAAFETARRHGITTILLSGRDGGAARSLVDHPLIVPSQTTARIQEVHTLILHQWLEAIDAADWSSLDS